MSKPLPQEQIDEMCRRFEAGETKKDIAKSMNLSQECVGRHTPSVYVKTEITDVLIQEMVRRVESGETRDEVAHSLNLGKTTVRRYTSHLPLVRRQTSPEEVAEVMRRAMAGESPAVIANDLKIHRSVVEKYAKRALSDYELTDDQRGTIWAEWDKGRNTREIASDLAIPVFVISTTLGTGAQVYSDKVREAVIRAIESGESYNSVSERLGVKPKLAHAWFHSAVDRGEAQIPKKPPGKTDDLKFKWITRLDPALEEWRELIVGWVQADGSNFGTTVSAVSKFIERYLIDLDLPRKPADLLQRGKLLPDFYAKTCPKSEGGRQYNSIIFRLIEWVLDSPGFADVGEEGPIRITELYRNPINPNVGNGYADNSISESNKVVMPYFLVSDLRKRIAQGPDFSDWKWVQGLMGYETINGQQKARDWFTVTEDQIDLEDPDCVWRIRKRENDPPVLEMWSPVRWVHALIHLQTTTRGGQLRMVDSGEADTFIWDQGRFVPNPSSFRLGTARKPRRQGIFRRPSPDEEAQGAKICLYFNSNKTADNGKSGIAKGFECPWPEMPNFEEDPYFWLTKLRDWQMKYNPIDKLTPWHELKGHAKLSTRTKEQAAEYPDTAFLFRAAENSDHPAWPIGSGTCYVAWQKLLAAYQLILADEGIKHPSGEPIELINPTNGLAWSSPHATRVSLITHLIMDGNVPPTIMMKIAGHARFIMTIYYTKASLAGIQNALISGAERIEQTKYQTFERDLLGAEAEQMRQKVVFNATDWQTVLPVNPADRNPLGWLHLHDGICLAGGNTGGEPSTPGCHNGGPVVLAPAGDKRARHGPVSGGVRNCCRCRWKAAGKQHILGLHATFNNRAYHMHKAKDDAISAERERNRMMQDKARVEAKEEPFARMNELINAERRHEAAMQKFQELALDVSAVHRTIERVMALPDNVDGPTALAAQGDLLSPNMLVEETDSELLQLASICADVELFPDLDPGTAIFEFAQLLDHAFEREGQPMIFARLSENEKLVAANGIMRELEVKANPGNPILGRLAVVEIMDRGASLEKMLGVKLNNILQLADHNTRKPISLRHPYKDMEESNDYK